VGGGFNLIPIAAAGNFSVGLLLFIFIARVITTLICFSSGAPGGIFAPMLALGTLLGTAFGMAATPLFPPIISMPAPSRLPEWGRCWPPRCARR
jgi:CIC family chloride channel protein